MRNPSATGGPARPGLVRSLCGCAAAAVLLAACSNTAPTASQSPAAADSAVGSALARLVHESNGPPGAIAVIQRGGTVVVEKAGVADVATGQAISSTDAMRLASVAKAFSAAAALALVAQGRLSMRSTVGTTVPGLPPSWAAIDLAQLLQHTSGIPDFSKQQAFLDAVRASPASAPPPKQLLSSVEGLPLSFTPGSRFEYSNSDNIVVALMVEAVTGAPYDEALQSLVGRPLGLTQTGLPSGTALPAPYLHGYDHAAGHAPEDASEVLAAGWSWASGGVVSTPADANRFVRGYVSGRTTNAATRSAQFRFVPGSSEPPGPGTNAVGLGVFRYSTSCGTVYGHTGNTLGYTQFVAASNDGTRSVTVSVTSQLTPTSNPERFAQLRHVFDLGVCAALA